MMRWENTKRSFKDKRNIVCLHFTVPLLSSNLISTFLSSIVEDSIKRNRHEGRGVGVGSMELRYNLATKVMRNGVEVIVATDRNARPIESEYLRVLSSTVTRPITLAPHTLTNLMSMMLPTDYVSEEQNHLEYFLQPTFITKTFYTTYNYLTTVLKDNSFVVSDMKTTVTNVKTEQYSKTKTTDGEIQPTSVSLKASPTLRTEVFDTAYTYMNTFMDGDQPLVMSSTYTVSNTLIGTPDFVELEPSEVFPTTNTYLKTVEFTKTLTDGTDYQIISTKDVLTQVVVTEKPGRKATDKPITTDVTKTYFVTYTYFSTYVDGDQTKVKSDVSVSSDVTIEKFYIKPKKTASNTVEKIRVTERPIMPTSFPFNIVATKTYLTTYTYFSTILHGSNNKKTETKIDSRTKVMENTVTETIHPEDLNTDYLIQLNNSLNRITGSLVATATLKRGEKVVITAYKNPSFDNSYKKYEIKPTKTVLNLETKVHFSQNVEVDNKSTKIKPTSFKSSSTLTKTKTTVLHKQKIKPTKTIVLDVTAEPLISEDQELSSSFSATPTVTMTPVLVNLANVHRTEINFFNYSVTASPTSTLISQESTITPTDEVNKTEDSSDLANSEPYKKQDIVKNPNNQMNVSNLLNLNSLGLNGINVLGPVFNAMAELIHNNLNKSPDVLTKRNDTVLDVKETGTLKKPVSSNINPLLNFVNKFTTFKNKDTKNTSSSKVKITTPRTPVYIPVGSFAQDSDFGESQNTKVIANKPESWHEKWTDTHAKNLEKVRPHDNPITILEGGIPISPGQVITTNSDVIIGRPGESGPRPPTFAVKNNVPIDMKPPPLPPVVLGSEDGDDFIGQHSTNQGIDSDYIKEDLNVIPPRPPLPPPPKKHLQESHVHKHIRPPHQENRQKGSSFHKNSHFNKQNQAVYDSGTIDLNPPPRPPPPTRSYDVHRPITINHEQNDDNDSHKSSQNIFPIPVHLGQGEHVGNYVNPTEIKTEIVGVPAVPLLNHYHHDNILNLISEATPTVDVINPNGGVLVLPTVAHIPLDFVATPNLNLLDRSTGHPLLVNIQPSQVANIVIPHGSSTALIVSGGKQHSLKGEVIDDPSPHPEPETVGFVGSEPVLKIENDDITTSLHNEVIPLRGEGGTQSFQDHREGFSNRPLLTTEVIKIRPKPTFSDVRIPDKHSVHSVSESSFQQVNFGQNAVFGHQPTLPAQNVPPLNYHQNQQIFQENHRQTEQAFQKGEGEIYINHNNDNQGVGLVKGGGGVHESLNIQNSDYDKNYRKEVSELNIFGHNHEEQNSHKISTGTHFGSNHHDNFVSGVGASHGQIHFNTGYNIIKGGNGIYVDVSPPGHLPPRPNVNQLFETHSSTKQQTSLKENLSNHQSGVVHDVPLNAQVQLGSGQKENPLKEILMNLNTNKHDNVPEHHTNEKPIDTKFSGSHKRPIEDFGDDLSPPPLPKEGNVYRPQRPLIPPPHATLSIQRHPPHSHSTIPQPVDFMVPPPKVSHRPSHRPHVDIHSRPVIPIGAGAPHQYYPSPRPEDMVIIPNKIRPGSHQVHYNTNNVKHDLHKQPTSNIYTNVGGGQSEPLKTEHGEEIQESISRPLFPGQLPSELQRFNVTFGGHQSNHKITDTSSKLWSNTEYSQTTKVKGNGNKPHAFKQPSSSKPETNFSWVSGNKEFVQDTLHNTTNRFTSDYNKNQSIKTVHGSTSIKLSNNNNKEVFASVSKPSGFVTTNRDEVTNKGNYHKESFDNKRPSSGFTNHKVSPDLSNHKDLSSFESLKVSSTGQGSSITGIHKVEINNVPSGFSVNNYSSNNSLRIHAVGPNILPSGFVKNENAVPNKVTPSVSVLSGNKTNQANKYATTNHKVELNIYNEDHSGTGSSVKISPNESPSFTNKNKGHEFVSSQHTNSNVNIKTKEQSQQSNSHKQESNKLRVEGVHQSEQNQKNPNNNELNKTFVNQTSQNNNNYGVKNQGNRPNKNSKPSEATSTIKFESNKIGIGYPFGSKPGTQDSGVNYSTRLPPDFISGQNTKQTKRPVGFTTPKEEEQNKKIVGFPDVDNIPLPTTDTKKLPQKISGDEIINSIGTIKTSFDTIKENETSLSFELKPNHNYGNKTANFHKLKPIFDVDQERDVFDKNAESDVNNWFAVNFGGNGANADKNTKSSVTNKLIPPANHRNVTFITNTLSSTDSNVHSMTNLTPPKVSHLKPKPEEVMGLSPPPLERPRRPQRPPRPKPPYKFEIPTTPKSTLTPIAIENDFPPVRSPEFNRKPLKPQDIFPPRLPGNFVHHIPEFPVRTPKPRPPERPPATSLPIDIPESSTTEKSFDIYPIDLEQSGSTDPFYAASEINGHSKPIFNADIGLVTLRPPPLPTTNKSKPVVQTRSSTIYQQTIKPSVSDKPKQELSSSHSKSKQKIIPSSTPDKSLVTPTFSEPVKTSYHTKVNTLLNPSETQEYKVWHDTDIITGSETIFDPDKFSHHITPTIKGISESKKIVTSVINTGSTTVFSNFYSSKPHKIPQESSETPLGFESEEDEDDRDINFETEKRSITPTPTVVPIYTTTLTVTTTMTTVVHSVGHKPSTKTIVFTKTLISTVFNKVTETKTLVKPTTATIIQTHTIATTKTALVVPTALYPSQTKYPTGGTLKPEIFVADPHAKDTMTISVSSSMNKNNKGDEKKKPVDAGANKSNGDSIVVVMSNKHPEISDGDNDNLDVISDDDNEINDSRVVLGGVFDASDEKGNKKLDNQVECSPGCKAKRNELCQRIEGVMKCVCRPGFARMFPDRPCRPTYTYNVQLMLEKIGSEQIVYEKNFAQQNTPNMVKLASATKEGLDRMIMQSELRDVYHGVVVNGFQGKEKKTMVDFYVQLSENSDETKLMDIFKKTLRASNYSLGGTELFAAREADNINAEDFNECLNSKFHDCSEHARCFNLKGTYTCSCKEGYTDLSENSLFPGRVCSDVIGCEYCGYHGACYSKGEGLITCECFQWYSGERCHINLKVLLIALVTIGAILLALLLVCAVLTCLNRRSRSSTTSRTNGYLRYRGPSSQSIDRRAMIGGDSSSESSVDNVPYINPPPLPAAATMSAKKKPALRHVKGPAPRPLPPMGMEQRDRSVTVMIPRAKYRPMPPLSPHLTMSTFSPDKHLHKTATQIATEQKLISYLDGNTREERNHANSDQSNRQTKEQTKTYEGKSLGADVEDSPRLKEKKKESRVFEYEYKMSNMLFSEETNSAERRSAKSLDNDRFRRHSDSTHMNSSNSNTKNFQFRKYSAGALVSAGYEVSAKVGMHRIEDDTTEDEHSDILNTHTMKSNRSQFTTLNRTGDHKTMSEARSYDETTIQPPTRSLKTHYSGSSPSSRVNNDEGHTMIERELGSTFIMPESQLFKPDLDRGSDISNFDSL